MISPLTPELLEKWKQEAIAISEKRWSALEPTPFQWAQRCIQLITALLSERLEHEREVEELKRQGETTRMVCDMEHEKTIQLQSQLTLAEQRVKKVMEAGMIEHTTTCRGNSHIWRNQLHSKDCLCGANKHNQAVKSAGEGKS